jgi:hypothetical protein
MVTLLPPTSNSSNLEGQECEQPNCWSICLPDRLIDLCLPSGPTGLSDSEGLAGPAQLQRLADIDSLSKDAFQQARYQEAIRLLARGTTLTASRQQHDMLSTTARPV